SPAPRPCTPTGIHRCACTRTGRPWRLRKQREPSLGDIWLLTRKWVSIQPALTLSLSLCPYRTILARMEPPQPTAEPPVPHVPMPARPRGRAEEGGGELRLVTSGNQSFTISVDKSVGRTATSAVAMAETTLPN